MRIFLVLAAVAVAVQGKALPAPFTEHCIVGEKSVYPGPNNSTVKTFVVDLDKRPEERWKEIATAYAEPIKELVQSAKGFLIAFLGEKIIDQLEQFLGTLVDKFPQPYADELRGIGAAVGLPLGDILLYNIFYEIDTVCTSIVAEDEQGKLYHARNLDFGVFLGWNEKSHDWSITEILRKSIINVDWRKNGQILFRSVNFAGYVGVYNGVRPKRFTITNNQRFGEGGGLVGILKWLKGDTSAWVQLLTREVLETADSYDEAITKLSTTPIMAPVYYIVGGSKPGEGAIIARSREGIVETVKLNPRTANGWYILEDNYDPSGKPLFIDDRRTPGNQCMQKLGRKNVGFEGIFNVLSSQTNLNKLTAYTTLMQVDTGVIETYIQKCKDPCWMV